MVNSIDELLTETIRKVSKAGRLKEFNEKTIHLPASATETMLHIAESLTEPNTEIVPGWRLKHKPSNVAVDSYLQRVHCPQKESSAVTESDAKKAREKSDRIMADSLKLNPEQRKALGIKESAEDVDTESPIYKQLRQLNFSESETKQLIGQGFHF